MNEQVTSKPKLLTIRQFVECHPFMTEGGLRYLIFNAESNGFRNCIRRIGRRVYVDEKLFFEWLELTQIDQKGKTTAFAKLANAKE